MIAAKCPFVRIMFLDWRIFLLSNLIFLTIYAFLCMLTLGVSTLMKSAFQFNVIFVIASVFYSQGRSNLDFFMS